MKKDLNYWLNMPKYHFRDYWKESKNGLLIDKAMIETELEGFQKHFIKVSEDKTTITFTRKEAFDTIQHHIAELEYLNRVLLFRRFWSPRDWRKWLQEKTDTIQFNIKQWQDKRKEKKVSKMNDEQKINFYRRKIRNLEQKIIRLYIKYCTHPQSDCSYYEWGATEDMPQTVKDKIKDLLLDRRIILDKIFRATPVEVQRFQEVNDQLHKLTNELISKVGTLYRRDLQYPFDEEYGDSYEANIHIVAYGKDNKNQYEGEDYYGSDIDTMLEIETDIWKDDYLGSIVNISKSHKKADKPEMTDEELGIRTELYIEGDDWKEYLHRISQFDDIIVCHAMHHLFDHLNFPLVDILHLNSFNTEIEHVIDKTTGLQEEKATVPWDEEDDEDTRIAKEYLWAERYEK